eukprot:366285-Chlamydomonas_euryale.AAC.5
MHAGPRVAQQQADPTQHTLRGAHLCHDGSVRPQAALMRGSALGMTKGPQKGNAEVARGPKQRPH